MKEMVDYGCANGWVTAPDAVKQCAAKGHKKERAGEEAHTDVRCEECGYKFWFDSSD